MANRNTVHQYSFATGVVAPNIRNRKDWERIDAALAECRNGTITPSGGARKRPGFRFVNDCLHNDKPIRKVTFRFSSDQVYELEFGDYLMRFYKDGGLIYTDAGEPYVLETPYSAQEAQEFTAAQERDAIFFAHWDKPLKQLTRFAHANWVWTNVFEEFDEDGNPTERIASPEHIEWFGELANGHNGYEYAVTAYKIVDGTPQESINYSTIYSDPDNADIIAEAPAKTLQSVYAWLEKYAEPYSADADYPPAIPDTIDFRQIQYDGDPPKSQVWWDTGSRWIDTALNAKLATVFRAAYGNNNIGGDYIYSGGSGAAPAGWGILSWVKGGTYTYARYYHVNYPGYYRSSTQTWYLKEIAMNYINAGVTLDGHGIGDVYQPVMDFIESWNTRYGPKVSNHIKWPGVDGASGYYVYRRLKESSSSKFWLVADLASTVTDWMDEDVTETIIRDKNPISGVNEFSDPDTYPNLVTFYQQRMVLGCTKEKPTTIFGSRTGIYRDYSIDASDNSSGYEFKMASQTSDPLEAILPLYTLAILTNGGDFISTITGAMNASNVNFNQKSYNGAASVDPIILGDNALYVSLSQKSINSMAYSYEKDGFRHDNILFNSQHYATGRKITGLAFQRDPINLIWAVLDNGTLLSCLYIPEQSFVAWTEHHTDGVVKSINMVPTTAGLDVISAVVERTLGDGTKKQYIEYLENMLPYSETPDAENSFFVDCGLSGIFEEESQTITGLEHLEGREVAILADNSVMPPRVVQNGQITLDAPAKAVHVGLPYEFLHRTLRMDLVDETLRDTRAQINRLIAELIDTRDIEWSANGGEFRDLVVHGSDDMSAPALKTGDIDLQMKAASGRGAYAAFRSRRPLPCEINSLVIEISRGDQ